MRRLEKWILISAIVVANASIAFFLYSSSMMDRDLAIYRDFISFLYVATVTKWVIPLNLYTSILLIVIYCLFLFIYGRNVK